jgi:hypothetical protein
MRSKIISLSCALACGTSSVALATPPTSCDAYVAGRYEGYRRGRGNAIPFRRGVAYLDGFRQGVAEVCPDMPFVPFAPYRPVPPEPDCAALDEATAYRAGLEIGVVTGFNEAIPAGTPADLQTGYREGLAHARARNCAPETGGG